MGDEAPGDGAQDKYLVDDFGARALLEGGEEGKVPCLLAKVLSMMIPREQRNIVETSRRRQVVLGIWRRRRR